MVSQEENKPQSVRLDTDSSAYKPFHTTHETFYSIAGTCGLWLHPSGASRVGYARWSLAMLAFDPRVTPHYLCLSCESKSELSPLLIQGQSLATLTFASLCLISLQGLSFINILVNSIIHPKSEPSLHLGSLQVLHHSFVLHYTTTSIYLHPISFINISV